MPNQEDVSVDEDRLREFVENVHESADRIEKGDYASEKHANGVCVGMRWVAHELEGILNGGGGDE